MLNGKDPISLQVLNAFESKMKLADIAAQFNLTLDQVKRIKRFYNYSKRIHALFGAELGTVFDELGTKGLALSKYIKANDAGAIQEILSIVPQQITRDELIQLTVSYDEKVSRLNQFEGAISLHSLTEASHIGSLEDSSITANLLTEPEIKRHRHLQSVAMKWLYRKGYIVASEIELPNKRIADVVGFKDGHVVIVEVKVNNEEYMRDEKWPDYLHYCDELYFIIDFTLGKRPPTGVIHVNEYDAVVEICKNRLSHQCLAVDLVTTSISRKLSRNHIFGY